MTDRAQPGAIDSVVRNYELGDIFGQFSDGWVVPADEPTASAQRSGIDETAFTAFDAAYSASSLTVTIGPGEAFVNGWLATDTPTDVDLAASTAGQTVGVSWDPDAAYDPDTDADRDAADRVVVALESEVPSVDPFFSLWTFETDGSGVISTSDERVIGPSLDPDVIDGADIRNASTGQFLRKSQSGLDFKSIVAGATVQPTEPATGENGQFWFNTTSNTLFVYRGSTSRWEPVSGIQGTDETSTFVEDDVTVTHLETTNSDSRYSNWEVDNPDTVDVQDKTGFVFEPKEILTSITLTSSESTGYLDGVGISDFETGQVLASRVETSVLEGGLSLTFDVKMFPGNKYIAWGIGESNTKMAEFEESNELNTKPVENEHLEIIQGYETGRIKDYSYYVYTFSAVETVQTISQVELKPNVAYNPDGAVAANTINDRSESWLYYSMFWDWAGPRDFYVRENGETVVKHITTTADYDLTTGTLQGSLDLSTVASGGGDGLYVTEDGSKLFTTDYDSMYGFTMSTPNDLNTISETASLDTSDVGECYVYHFSNDGTTMYTVGEGRLNTWSLSTPYDISTAAHDGLDLDTGGTEYSLDYSEDGAFADDGKKLFFPRRGSSTIPGQDGPDVVVFELSTAYDPSTATFVTNGAESEYGRSIYVSNDGTVMHTTTEDGYTIFNMPTRQSGSALIEWDAPSTITSWDIATYIEDETSGSVRVDVVDQNGNVLKSDVSRNDDISSISNDENIAFEVVLNRGDDGETPHLSYIARRFVV